MCNLDPYSLFVGILDIHTYTYIHTYDICMAWVMQHGMHIMFRFLQPFSPQLCYRGGSLYHFLLLGLGA